MCRNSLHKWACYFFVMIMVTIMELAVGAKGSKNGIPARLTIFRNDSVWSYSAEISKQGNQLSDGFMRTAILLTPPETSFGLCEPVPDNFSASNIEYSSFGSIRSVAVLAGRGNNTTTCSLLTKVRTALEFKHRISQHLKYVVFPNEDHFDPNKIISQYIPMEGSASSTNSIYDLRDLTILFVSRYTGESLRNHIAEIENETIHYEGMDPTTSDLWNEYFATLQLVMKIERTSNIPVWLSLYYLMFFVPLPAVLISWAYAKWRAGARMQFRRNGQNQIIGIQLIQPARPQTLPQNQMEMMEEESRNRMTKDQVLSLPEIPYQNPTATTGGTSHTFSPPSVDDDDLPTTEQNNLERVSSVPDSCRIIDGNDPILNVITEGTKNKKSEEEGMDTTDMESCTVSPNSSSSDFPHDGVQSPEKEIKTKTTTTTTSSSVLDMKNSMIPFDTTCSICIQDFEAGELIRLLPKCNHAFHTECIMLWLTERQGCCPLCKTIVMDENDEANGDSNPRSSP